jgi:hypothetical protein
MENEEDLSTQIVSMLALAGYPINKPIFRDLVCEYIGIDVCGVVSEGYIDKLMKRSDLVMASNSYSADPARSSQISTELQEIWYKKLDNIVFLPRSTLRSVCGQSGLTFLQKTSTTQTKLHQTTQNIKSQ